MTEFKQFGFNPQLKITIKFLEKFAGGLKNKQTGEIKWHELSMFLGLCELFRNSFTFQKSLFVISDIPQQSENKNRPNGTTFYSFGTFDIFCEIQALTEFERLRVFQAKSSGCFFVCFGFVIQPDNSKKHFSKPQRQYLFNTTISKRFEPCVVKFFQERGAVQ